MVILGDSITAFGEPNTGNAWHRVFATLAGKVRHRGEFATAGFTLEQIETTWLPSVLAMSPLPGACIIAGGTNNLGATGNTGAYDPIAARATLLRIIAKLQAAGVMPILWCPPPRNDSATVNTYTQRWNAWVKYTAQTLGLPFVDAYSAVVDPTTGLYQTAAMLNTVHPNALGHYLIGKAAAANVELLARLNNDVPHLATDKLDAANLIPNGYGLFNQGVTGVPNNPVGWSAYGGQGTSFTFAQSPGAAPVIGNWEQLTVPAGGGVVNGGLQYNLTAGFSAGDHLGLAVRVQSACPDDASAGNLVVTLGARAAGTTTSQASRAGFGGTWQGVVWEDLVVPAGTDTIRATLAIQTAASPAAAASVSFAQATLVNLTTLASS
jgi:lysophospholipase L1-like esterase